MVESKNKIRVGQIGVGYWGPNLMRNLVSNPEVELAGVADLSEERRAYVSGLYPTVKTTANPDELIKDPDIDALVIATPVHTHFELAQAALREQKHILVEKPMATSVAEVEQLEVIARENNLVLMSGHTFIYNSAVRYLKNLIHSGDLGDIRYIYSHRLNLGRIRSDVDAMWNLAPHDISIVQYLFDDPEPLEITRRGECYVQEGIEDVSFLTIRYPNQLLVNIHVSWLDPNRTRKMVVVGSRKMVIYDDASENKITIYDKGIDRMAELGKHMDYDQPKYNHRSGDIHIPKINWKEPLRTEVEHFVECITEACECITGPVHTKKLVGILEQASVKRQSQQTNQEFLMAV